MTPTVTFSDGLTRSGGALPSNPDRVRTRDTVLATLALSVAAGAALREATIVANAAAGVVVGKLGTAWVSPAELLAALRASSTGFQCSVS